MTLFFTPYLFSINALYKKNNILSIIACFAYGRVPVKINSMKLENRFTPPANWTWDYFNDPAREKDGHKIRFGFCHAPQSKAVVVIAQGRSQTAEEYFEFARDCLKRNLSVAIMDWQGHGGSYRFNDDNTRHHSRGFDDDVTDFALFIKQINAIDEFQSQPKILFAHSMGGNITMHTLAQSPALFKCAFMVSPMLGIKLNQLTKALSKIILRVVRIFGSLNAHAPGQKKWNEATYKITAPFISSDKIRRDIQKYWCLKNPELQCGGVSYGWIHHAFKSINTIKEQSFCSSIKTPIFLCIADKDKVVSNSSIRDVASKIPHAEMHVLKKSQHIAHVECDEIRNNLFRAFDAFVQKHLP